MSSVVFRCWYKRHGFSGIPVLERPGPARAAAGWVAAALPASGWSGHLSTLVESCDVVVAFSFGIFWCILVGYAQLSIHAADIGFSFLALEQLMLLQKGDQKVK